MRVLLGGAVVCGALWTAGAQAMMPPEVYQEARDSATYHLTVEIVAVTPSEDAFGDCQVEAKVVDVARDLTESLGVGDPVSFSVNCLRADADPDEIPMCVMFLRTENLVVGARLDAYLNGGPDAFNVAEGQVSFVDAAAGASPDA